MAQVEKEALMGKVVKALVGTEVVEGIICGRLLKLPVFMALKQDLKFELTWPLAKKAAEGAVIQY